MEIKEIFNEENRDKQYRFLNYEDKHIYTILMYICVYHHDLKIYIVYPCFLH